MPTPDYAVIGGGIVGLTIARELAMRGGGVTVFEKEAHLGEHASGRNSGVLHAGFYYAPDSLKARLTARGNQLLRAFCAEHDVRVRSCGKVVVASTPEQLPALDELVRRGTANGVRLETVDERGLAVPERTTSSRRANARREWDDAAEACRRTPGCVPQYRDDARFGESKPLKTDAEVIEEMRKRGFSEPHPLPK